ncbi:hypothetical protein M513_14089 [Trichuris suis]|uniref:Uncharacterized protein n=1 Tax=Trichuris suis TaxID=68888 RepID=A0A085LJ88_9BILA|nr:hypothetical protein M513_14089 [Trichuris suis]
MNSNIPITTGQIEILQTREELRRVKITPFRMRHYSTRRPKRKIGKYISRKQIRMSNFILTSIIVNNMFFPSDGTAFIGACQRGVFIRREYEKQGDDGQYNFDSNHVRLVVEQIAVGENARSSEKQRDGHKGK